MMADVEKFHFRLVLLGSHGTGKTSILNRFLFKKFGTKYKPTVEDLFSKEFDLGSIEIKVDFLDTSGSMQFPAMRRLSISTGSAFLIVYAVDDESSYDVLKMCIQEIQEIRPDYQEIPIVFAGNKCDFPREKRKVLKETVSNYVHYELPRLRAKVIECSCRDGINIENIFKAYLSLAKVTLSAAVSATKTTNTTTYNNNRPASNPLSNSIYDEQQHSNSNNNNNNNNNNNTSSSSSRRTSSLKVALGVRKSCDASIISPSKGKLNSPKLNNSKETLANDFYGTRKDINNNNNNNSNSQSINDKNNNNSASSELVNLETAIRSKLHIDNGSGASSQAKPRSRSLIWRPSRRSQHSVRQTNDNNDCKIT